MDIFNNLDSLKLPNIKEIDNKKDEVYKRLERKKLAQLISLYSEHPIDNRAKLIKACEQQLQLLDKSACSFTLKFWLKLARKNTGLVRRALRSDNPSLKQFQENFPLTRKELKPCSQISS